jgi:hypothetical protein
MQGTSEKVRLSGLEARKKLWRRMNYRSGGGTAVQRL